MDRSEARDKYLLEVQGFNIHEENREMDRIKVSNMDKWSFQQKKVWIMPPLLDQSDLLHVTIKVQYSRKKACRRI